MAIAWSSFTRAGSIKLVCTALTVSVVMDLERNYSGTPSVQKQQLLLLTFVHTQANWWVVTSLASHKTVNTSLYKEAHQLVADQNYYEIML